VASRRLALGSRVRAKTKVETECVGKYMVRPIMALDRLLFLEGEGKVGDRHGQNGAELELMTRGKFIGPGNRLFGTETAAGRAGGG
jgi:hypothetical protein